MTLVKHKSFADTPLLETADKLHSAAIHLLRRLRLRDRESGIGPAQLSALSVLVFGGPRSPGELAEAEQVKRPTMTRIAAGLVRAGLAKRRRTEDGRSVRLDATEKGTRILWEARKRRVESLAQALQVLSEEEQEKMRELLPHLEKIIGKL